MSFYIISIYYFSGRGQLHHKGPISDELESLAVPVWNQTTCRKSYPEHTVTNSMMCVGIPGERKSTCKGDSGGPFMISIPPFNRWHVVGLVSWNVLCGLMRNPSVFTRVNHYLEWIQNPSEFEDRSFCLFNDKRLEHKEYFSYNNITVQCLNGGIIMLGMILLCH